MVSFIILHYKNIKDTIECIESINKLKNKDKSIVVVDNNTLTKKEENSILKYTKDLIKMDKNEGFARGNNAGCEYAIKKYSPDFLCVINNDTIINQTDFIDIIYNSYKETNFDIMGPKIITEGDSVNPFYAYSSIDEIDNIIKYHKKLIKIYSSRFLTFLLNFYMKIKHLFIKRKKLVNAEESQYDVALHGCALIFSKKYYKKYESVFYPETFLYHEEEFLDYRRRKDKLITYYNSNLEIYHKEGSSLNETFKNKNNDKLIFRNKEIVKSLELLKKVLHEDKSI